MQRAGGLGRGLQMTKSELIEILTEKLTVASGQGSQKDIEICLGFDVNAMRDDPNFMDIRGLHEALVSSYAPEDEAAAI